MHSGVLSAPSLVGDRPGRQRWRERRRLADQARRSADRAQVFLLGGLLADAGDLVAAGWTQHCWFTVRDDAGARRRIGPSNLHEMGGNPVAEVCLVGAVVEAGGGIAQAGTQSVHRALDLTWATLYHQAVQWCPAPPVRLAHVHDLTRWNDAPGRTSGDVAGLLAAAAQRAAVRS